MSVGQRNAIESGRVEVGAGQSTTKCSVLVLFLAGFANHDEARCKGLVETRGRRRQEAEERKEKEKRRIPSANRGTGSD